MLFDKSLIFFIIYDFFQNVFLEIPPKCQTRLDNSSKHPFVLIHITDKVEVGTMKLVKALQ